MLNILFVVVRKMEGARLVSELIEKYHPRTILDLWAWKWYFSILAASYWAQVDAVEDTTIRNQYPDYLKAHPNVTFHESKLEEYEITKNYDLVIVLWKFINSIYQHLNRGWLLFLTYHHSDSELWNEKEWLVQYSLSDFKSFRWNYTVKDFWDYTNPAPWINKEYKIWYVILQKN